MIAESPVRREGRQPRRGRPSCRTRKGKRPRRGRRPPLLSRRAPGRSPAKESLRRESASPVRSAPRSERRAPPRGARGPLRPARGPVRLGARGGGGGEPCPDGPHGLVSEREARRRHGEPVERAELGPKYVPRASRLTLSLRLADAVERSESFLGEPRHLAGKVRFALAPKKAPFAVAHENERDAGVFQHRGGHLARERALALVEHVLGRERNAASQKRRADAVESRERGGDRDVHSGGPREGGDRASQLRGRRRRTSHLPVRDEKAPALSQRRASTPGSAMPATRSSEAPPPVDTCDISAASPAS